MMTINIIFRISLFLVGALMPMSPGTNFDPVWVEGIGCLSFHGRQGEATPFPPNEQKVVRIVMFWMNGCPHCHEVLDNVLPPLQEKYGEKLEIKLIELVGAEEVDALYKLAENRGIPKDKVGDSFSGDRRRYAYRLPANPS